MALTIVRNDIVKMKVDAIVNSTNEFLQPGGHGVDAAIHAAAGPGLQEELNRVGYCAPDCLVITGSHNIKTCSHIIHVVGPRYIDGQHGEAEALWNCYDRILNLAYKKCCRSLAIPSISSGAYAFPKEEAYKIATSCIRQFLFSLGEDEDMMIYLVLFDQQSVEYGNKIDRAVKEYISTSYAEKKKQGLGLKFKLRKNAVTQAPQFGGSIPAGAMLREDHPDIQSVVSKEDITELKKAHKRAGAVITGSTKNMVIGAVSTTALVAVSGGLAFAFAPAIAATLVGEAAAGLSGAALVSYSLAAIGGGSLAAGGLGMAGGTAIITGGGALLGMLGGTGVSAATTMSLLSDDSYVLAECCKLLTFCRAVLIDRFHDTASVGTIQADIDKQIAALREKLEEEPEKTEEEKAKSEKSEEIEGEIKEKDKAKIAKKSIKYLKNTSDVLRKAVLKEQPANSTKKALPAPPSV